MGGFDLLFFRYRSESLFDPTFRPVAKRIHMMAFRMHQVTSQNLIIISHIKKIHIHSSEVRRFHSARNAAAVSGIMISSARAAVVLFRKQGSRLLRSPMCLLLLHNKPLLLPRLSLPLLKPMSLLLRNQPRLLPHGHLCPASPCRSGIRVLGLPLSGQSASPVSARCTTGS